MPRMTGENPQKRFYRFHGVLLEGEGNEGIGECPFCGKVKLHVALGGDDGRFKCMVCGVSGNPTQFLRQLHKESMKQTRSYEWIEAHRGLPVEVLKEWGVCQSIATREWIIPGYLSNGAIGYLYHYKKDSKKMRLMNIGGSGMFGKWSLNADGDYILNLKKDKLYITEGAWDGMRLGQVVDGETVDVVSVPGCNIFQDKWSKFTEDKSVTLFFDNDHPDKQGKCAAFEGLKHAVKVMTAGDEKPKDINCLVWGEKGYTEDYSSGFDVRDMLSEKMGGSEEERLAVLLGMVKPVPVEWVNTDTRGSGKAIKIFSEPCDSWKVVVNICKRALKWTKELEGALAIILASITSVPHPGEQLWIKLISPPSGGKTSLCEMVAVARKFVHSESLINGFYSGYVKKDDNKDYSLAAKLFDKTLITKDGDTLLTSESRDVTLAQARDLYDGAARKAYNNSIRRDYEGLRFTWIIAGTSSLRKLDRSELGQRCLDYVIMDEIDDELEDDMITRSAYQQVRNSKMSSNGKVETTMDSDYVKACKLVGGYVEYLRRNGEYLIKDIKEPDEVIDRCGRLAKFTAYMRARPSTTQDEGQDRELAMRLTKQLVKLAQFLTVIYNKTEIDVGVMKLVKKVAMDTSRGRTLEIVRALATAKEKGLDVQTVAQMTNQSSIKEGEYLRFLRKIKVVEAFTLPNSSTLKVRWRLTPVFERVYREVMKS